MLADLVRQFLGVRVAPGVFDEVVVTRLFTDDSKERRSALALCFTLGFVITGFGHLMFMKAAQILPAGEVTFLMLIEFVMAPLWVWIFVNEVPRASTLIGGGMVLTSVTGWAYYRLRAAQRGSLEP